MNPEQKIKQIEEEQKRLSKEMVIFASHTEHLSHIRKDINDLKENFSRLEPMIEWFNIMINGRKYNLKLIKIIGITATTLLAIGGLMELFRRILK